LSIVHVISLCSKPPPNPVVNPGYCHSQSAVTALFPVDVSIDDALEEAAGVLGLPGPPEYDVSMTKDQDWVETIKVRKVKGFANARESTLCLERKFTGPLLNRNRREKGTSTNVILVCTDTIATAKPRRKGTVYVC
jgi:hypothetical protein